MRVETDIEDLGVSSIEIAGLKIWTHGRKYPEHQDFWDGNRLNATFHCKAQRASVWVSGDILHLSEFADRLIELEKLHKTLSGEAILDTLERYV
jgi:hypothetical protein